MRTRGLLHALVAGAVLCLAAGAADAATITIVQGAGFNDPTPRAPEGGNSGTTLGAQRLIAFQNAAAIWGGKLVSGQEIKVAAAFTDLLCGPTSGVLGSAGPTNFFVLNEPGVPNSSRFFAVALAEALLNQNINMSSNEINANFNAVLDLAGPGCLGGSRWYYGLTSPAPPGSVAFIPTILHELGHGLGFLSLLCDSPGGCGSGMNFTPFGGFFSGVPDIWSDFVRDNGTQPSLWVQMTDAQRSVSFTNDPLVVWSGPSVTASLAAFGLNGAIETNGGFLRIYAPDPFEDGSSISHFHEDASPNLLMEPSATADVFNQTDVTDLLFQDIGWTLTGGGPTPNQAPTVAGPASIAVTEDVASPLTGISFNDADIGSGMLTATFSAPQGSIAASGAVPGVTVGGTVAARTITGTLAGLNAYIVGGNVTYTTAPSATASVTLGVTANDNGNTGFGGPLTGSRNIMLTVNQVNDPPNVNAPPTFAATEDTASALIGISIADVDAGAGNVQLTAQVASGTLSTVGSGVTVTGSGTATVALTGSVAAINTFLQNASLRYTTALNATASASLNLTVNDQGNTGSGGQLTGNTSASITITGVNDPPSVSGPSPIPVVPTGQSTIAGVSFADIDSGAGSITVTWAVASGTMSATAGGGVTVGGSGTASMTTSGTLANLNAFVSAGNVKFDTPGGTTADIVLTVTVNDNGNSPAPPQSGNRQFTLSFDLVYRNGFEDPPP